MGAYGTFLEWCLHYFSGRLHEDDLPFKSNGSSHKFKGFPLDFPGYITSKDYFLSSLTSDTARSHGLSFSKISKTVKTYIDTYKNYVRFLINIVADQDYRLLVLHNSLTKLSNEGANSIVQSFNKIANVSDFDDIWIRREKMSFHLSYIHTFWDYNENQNTNQLNITVSDLLNNFKETLILIFDKLNLEFDSTRLAKIDWVIQEWVSLQTYKHRDKLCRDIVEYTVNNVDFDWSKENLTIYDEAYIQMRLRTLHNTGLRCYNVNEFPTNSSDLRKILIHGKPV